MKLKQLTESFEQQVGTQADTTAFDKDVEGKRGWFAHIKGDQDPFMVNKINHRNDDAYDLYVQFIVDNKLAQSNPHFPRIYEINHSKQWKMEKLPYTLDKFFYRNDDAQNKDNVEMLCNLYLKKYDPDTVSTDDFMYPEKIKLGTYRKALELVKTQRLELRTKGYRLADDLGGNNIMVRLTPQGPQLVITDPWS